MNILKLDFFFLSRMMQTNCKWICLLSRRFALYDTTKGNLWPLEKLLGLHSPKCGASKPRKWEANCLKSPPVNFCQETVNYFIVDFFPSSFFFLSHKVGAVLAPPIEAYPNHRNSMYFSEWTRSRFHNYPHCVILLAGKSLASTAGNPASGAGRHQSPPASVHSASQTWTGRVPPAGCYSASRLHRGTVSAAAVKARQAPAAGCTDGSLHDVFPRRLNQPLVDRTPRS